MVRAFLPVSTTVRGFRWGLRANLLSRFSCGVDAYSFGAGGAVILPGTGNIGAHCLGGVQAKDAATIWAIDRFCFSGLMPWGVCDPCKGVPKLPRGVVSHLPSHLSSPTRPVQTPTSSYLFSTTTPLHHYRSSSRPRFLRPSARPSFCVTLGVCPHFLCLSKCPSTIPRRTSVFGRAR